MTQQTFIFRKPADAPAVAVRGGDLETAIRVLRRRAQRFGALKALNIRKKYPNPKARRRAKDRKAAQRFQARQHGKD